MFRRALILVIVAASLLVFQNCGSPKERLGLDGDVFTSGGEEPWHGSFTGVYEDFSSSCQDGTRGHRIEFDPLPGKYRYVKKDCELVTFEVQIDQWIDGDKKFIYDGRTFEMAGR